MILAVNAYLILYSRLAPTTHGVHNGGLFQHGYSHDDCFSQADFTHVIPSLRLFIRA